MLVEDAEMRTVGQIGFGKEFVYEQMRLPQSADMAHRVLRSSVPISCELPRGSGCRTQPRQLDQHISGSGHLAETPPDRNPFPDAG